MLSFARYEKTRPFAVRHGWRPHGIRRCPSRPRGAGPRRYLHRGARLLVGFRPRRFHRAAPGRAHVRCRTARRGQNAVALDRHAAHGRVGPGARPRAWRRDPGEARRVPSEGRVPSLLRRLHEHPYRGLRRDAADETRGLHKTAIREVRMATRPQHPQLPQRAHRGPHARGLRRRRHLPRLPRRAVPQRGRDDPRRALRPQPPPGHQRDLRREPPHREHRHARDVRHAARPTVPQRF